MLLRLITRALVPVLLAACANSNPVVIGPDHPANPAATAIPIAPPLILAAYQPVGSTPTPPVAPADARASALVNAVDPDRHSVNLSHEAIPAIGWPAMTMDFAVDPAVRLNLIKPGARVTVALRRGKDGMYQVYSITPAVGP